MAGPGGLCQFLARPRRNFCPTRVFYFTSRFLGGACLRSEAHRPLDKRPLYSPDASISSCSALGVGHYFSSQP